jgi:hypothetical protein
MGISKQKPGSSKHKLTPAITIGYSYVVSELRFFFVFNGHRCGVSLGVI